MKKKNSLSTYERIMQDPQRKARFEEEYLEFILLDTLIPLLEKRKSVTKPSNFSKDKKIN